MLVWHMGIKITDWKSRKQSWLIIKESCTEEKKYWLSLSVHLGIKHYI